MEAAGLQAMTLVISGITFSYERFVGLKLSNDVFVTVTDCLQSVGSSEYKYFTLRLCNVAVLA